MEPASIRYKNPGAMWGSALARKWGAHPNPVVLNDGLKQGNNIAVFDSFEDGICAQLDLWRTSKNYRNKKFIDAITIWSGGNYVQSYVDFVLKRVPGMAKETVMNDRFWNGPMCIPFLKAQAWHEAGKPYPASEADWDNAKERVLHLEHPDRPEKEAHEGPIVPVPLPKPAPQPKEIVVPESEVKPLVKSKTFWSVLGGIGTTLGGLVTDWHFLAALVVLIIFGYIIWERNGKPDIRGYFRK